MVTPQGDDVPGGKDQIGVEKLIEVVSIREELEGASMSKLLRMPPKNRNRSRKSGRPSVLANLRDHRLASN
jgi:hypothetical protein